MEEFADRNELKSRKIKYAGRQKPWQNDTLVQAR